jgi:hypothetical protein
MIGAHRGEWPAGLCVSNHVVANRMGCHKGNEARIHGAKVFAMAKSVVHQNDSTE